MRIVFMGTPAFAVPSLAALLGAGHEIVAVVTQPDRPRGRGQTVQPPPVKRLALERGLEVLQPERLRDPVFAERLGSLAPDLIVVAAYGKILPKTILDLPPRGAINVHGSLLPRYRGAAPIQRCLLSGETVTGVTIMQMNEKMDAGDILLTREMPIHDDDTSESLGNRMAEIGADALVEGLTKLERGELRPIPQRDEDATLAPLVRKEEGEIEWNRSAAEIGRAVRAFFPWPGAVTRLHGKRLKILRALAGPASASAPPGTIMTITPEEIGVATGSGTLSIREIQLEGKRRIVPRDLLTGRLARVGDRLGDRSQSN